MVDLEGNFIGVDPFHFTGIAAASFDGIYRQHFLPEDPIPTVPKPTTANISAAEISWLEWEISCKHLFTQIFQCISMLPPLKIFIKLFKYPKNITKYGKLLPMYSDTVELPIAGTSSSTSGVENQMGIMSLSSDLDTVETATSSIPSLLPNSGNCLPSKPSLFEDGEGWLNLNVDTNDTQSDFLSLL